MAEFTEVVRQYNRMCDENNCNKCPMCQILNPETVCKSVVLSIEHAADAEKIIMDWAAAHPEPQYPTWIEWQESILHDTRKAVCPMALDPNAKCHGGVCSICDTRKNPIPADIAEKLKIKPKEEK